MTPVAPAPSFSVVLTGQQPGPWLAVLLASLLRAGDGLHWELVAALAEGQELLGAFAEHLPAGRLQLLPGSHRNLAKARNRALQHCRGDLVAFVSSEQRCCPQRLALPHQLLQQHPTIDLLAGGWLVGEINHQPWREGSGFDAATLLRHRALRLGCITVRRSALERLGGVPNQSEAWSGIDLALGLQSQGSQAAWMNQPLMRYRPRHQLACDGARLQRGMEQLMEHHGQGIQPEQLLELRFAALGWSAGLAWQQQLPEQALQLLQQAALSAPLPVPRARVQLLEQFGRSQRWCGGAVQAEALLHSETWRRSLSFWP
ncbi:MAG: hypothetical protein K0U63_09195 [Cyanobacteria bacterium]|nr:hypothetical protein [Cyanobacteriota bacterium]